MSEYPSGISYPFRFGNAGGIKKSFGDDKIKSNLQALIYSPVNSRLIRKLVGTISYQKVFKTIQYSSFDPLISLVQEAITKFEPRIKILNIKIKNQERTEGGVFFIEVSFVRKTSNDINTLQIDLE